MKKLSKVVVFVLVVALCLTMFGGCKKDEKMVLNVYSWWDITAQPGLQQLKSGFEEKYKDDNVELNFVMLPGTGYAGNMLTNIGAGVDDIDVMMLAVDQVPIYAKSGALVDLTDKLSQSYKDDLFDVVKDSITVNGKYFAVARDVSAMAMYLNKDVFEKCGVALPNDDWTMDDFTRIAGELSKGTGKDQTFGYCSKRNPGDIFTMVNIFGGEFFDATKNESLIDKLESIEAIWYMYDMVEKQNFMTTQQMLAYGKGFDYEAFNANAVGMIYGANSVATNLSKDVNYVVRPIPKNNGVSKSYAFVNTWAIPKTAKNLDWSVKVAEYFSNAEGQKIITDTGMGLPAAKSVDVTEFLEKNPNNKYFIDAVSNSKSYPKGVAGAAFQNALKLSLNERLWDVSGLTKDQVTKIVLETDAHCQKEMDSVA